MKFKIIKILFIIICVVTILGVSSCSFLNFKNKQEDEISKQIEDDAFDNITEREAETNSNGATLKSLKVSPATGLEIEINAVHPYKDLQVQGVFSDGSIKDFSNNDLTITKVDLTKAGSYYALIQYKSYACTYLIKVIDTTVPAEPQTPPEVINTVVDELKINFETSKLIYNINDTFDIDNIYFNQDIDRNLLSYRLFKGEQEVSGQLTSFGNYTLKIKYNNTILLSNLTVTKNIQYTSEIDKEVSYTEENGNILLKIANLELDNVLFYEISVIDKTTLKELYYFASAENSFSKPNNSFVIKGQAYGMKKNDDNTYSTIKVNLK